MLSEGVKVTGTLQEAPSEMATPQVPTVTVKAGSDEVIEESEIGRLLLLLVRVTYCGAKGMPVAPGPKSSEAGESVMAGGGAEPVPVRFTL